jgi:hypothetical protein
VTFKGTLQALNNLLPLLSEYALTSSKGDPAIGCTSSVGMACEILQVDDVGVAFDGLARLYILQTEVDCRRRRTNPTRTMLASPMLARPINATTRDGSGTTEPVTVKSIIEFVGPI